MATSSPFVHPSGNRQVYDLGDNAAYDAALEVVATALEADPLDQSAHLARIAYLRYACRYDEAEAAALEALQRRPDDVEIMLGMARMWSTQELEEEALGWAERALAIEPANVRALEARIDFLRYLRRYAEAEEAARAAAVLHPAEPDILIAAAWVANAMEKDDEAVEWVDRAVAAAPDTVDVLQARIEVNRFARRFEQADIAITEAMARYPEDPELMLSAAWVVSAQYRDDETAEWIERALAVAPRHSVALGARVRLLMVQRRFSEAESATNLALALRPDDPELLQLMARIFFDQDRFDEAWPWLDRALELDPHAPGAIEIQTDLYRAARRFDEALAVAMAEVARRPFEPELYATVSVVHLSQMRYSESVAWSDLALQLEPRHNWALRIRMTALQGGGELAAAEASAREAAARCPQDPQVLVAAARVLHNPAANDESDELIERALALDPAHVDAHEARIDFLRYARRYPEAEAVAAEAVELHPATPSILIARARLASQQDREDEAVEWVERALAVQPAQPDALEARINYLRYGNRYAEAEAAAAVALEHHPTSPDILLTTAAVYTDLDLPLSALVHIRTARSADPDNSAAVAAEIDCLRTAHRYDEANAAMREGVERFPFVPEVLIAAAWNEHAQGHADQAIHWANRVLSVDPNHSWGIRTRLSILQYSHRYAEADAAAAAAAVAQPEDAAVLATVAWVCNGQRRYDDALAHVDQALRIEPGYVDALVTKVYALRRARRLVQAEDTVRDAIAARPREPKLLMAAAWVYSVQDREEEALAMAEAALAIEPRHADALAGRVDFLRFMERATEAEAAAQESVSLRPDDPELALGAARVYFAMSRHAEALFWVERAIALDKFSDNAHQARIETLRAGRRFDEAEQAFQDALEQLPADPDVLISAAWLANDLGQTEEALRRIDRALTADTRHTDAHQARIDTLRAARRFAEAEEAFRVAVEHLPYDVDIHISAAWLANDQGRTDEAMRRVETALAADARDSDALLCRIDLLRLNRQYDVAEQRAMEAIEVRAADLKLRVALGRVQDARQNFAGALLTFENALQLSPWNLEAQLARSFSLRSLRRHDEAYRTISELHAIHPTGRALKAELAWIHLDQRRFADAKRGFEILLSTSVNDHERSAALFGLGWTNLARKEFGRAEDRFRAAVASHPSNPEYQLAVAWSLLHQSQQSRWHEAQEICQTVLDSRPTPAAHVCLGILAFKFNQLASAEYHLKAAIALDPHQGSHTDLGALYVQLSRHEEARAELQQAIDRDWYDLAAHIEMGVSLLQDDEDCLPDAERQFRQALAIEPGSGVAAIGLALTLDRMGSEGDAEAALRAILQRTDVEQRWRVELALARLLIKRGEKQQNADLFDDAYVHAQRAIAHAPNNAADPSFVAGLAHYRMGSLSFDANGRAGVRRRALQHLRTCLEIDPFHSEAQRSSQILEREIRTAAPAAWGGYAVGTMSIALLTLTWAAFFFSSKITGVMLASITPALIGLFIVATLLPALIRLKMPGFEAELQSSAGKLSPGPTGEMTLSPGRFAVTTGPMGQLHIRHNDQPGTSYSTDSRPQRINRPF